MAKALIVGAGINGLATAWALVNRGWQVEIVERGPIPNPVSASFDRHRLIRSQYTDPGYAARMPAAFAAWRALWRDLGRNHYVERGILALSREPGDWTDRARAAFTAAELAIETIGPEEVAKRYPMLETEGVRFALFTPEGGVLFSDLILHDLATWLARAGARFHPNTRVERVDFAAGRVQGSGVSFAGDAVILALGVGLPLLVPELAPVLTPRRSVVVYAAPAPRWQAAWARAPAWVDMGGEDDLWGIPPVGDIPMKLGFGRLTRIADPETDRPVTPDDTARTLAAYRDRFRDIDAFRPVETVANFYLMAPEERFLLRRQGRVLILSADSGHGFKFGALTGLDVAESVESGDWESIAERLAGHSAPSSHEEGGIEKSSTSSASASAR